MFNRIFNLKNLIWFCAIGLATFSGYYSVFGISKLFSGGSWSIVGMAAMLELSKLVVVTFLHDHFKNLKIGIKFYLSAAIVVLMSITSIGVYGYLTNSYQETAKVIYKAQNETTLLDQKKKLFEEQKKQLDASINEKTNRLKSFDQIRVSQQNAYTQQLTQKRGTGNLSKNISSIDKSSEILNNEISNMTSKSFALSDSISVIEQNKLTISNESFSSELGPLLYLSRITGLPMDIVVNWFIIILVIVFDPLAISLVVAANHLKTNQTIIVEEPIEEEEMIEEPVIEESVEDPIEEKLNLINDENFRILDEEMNEEYIQEDDINEFYDEKPNEDSVKEESFNNGVDNPWKRALPFIR